MLFRSCHAGGQQQIIISGDADAFRVYTNTNATPTAVAVSSPNGAAYDFPDPQQDLREFWIECTKPSTGAVHHVYWNDDFDIPPFTNTLIIAACEMVAQPVSRPPVDNAPAYFAPGSNVTYTVSILPAHLADQVVWSNSNNSVVSFVSGNTGTNITIKAIAEGEAILYAIPKGFIGRPPEFNIQVTNKRPAKATVFLVCDDSGNPPAGVDESTITNRFIRANPEVAQFGIELQIESISRTNNAAWHTMPRDVDVDAAYAQMSRVYAPTNNLKIFFVGIMNGGNTLGFNGSYAMAIASNASDTTFPHEVGHAHGLPDIYPYRRNRAGVMLTVTGLVAQNRMDALDWGAGYYPSDLTQSNLINRVLMCGYANPERGHLPHGKIEGLNVNAIPGMIGVGFKDITKPPQHQTR